MAKKVSKKGSKVQVESPAHYAGVLLEEIRDQIKLVAESASVTRDFLESRIEGSRVELKQEIADVRTGLSARIDSVRTELKGEIVSLRTELKGEIVSLRTELKEEISSVRTELSETRSELSVKIDLIGVRIDKNEEGIRDLRQSQNLC